MEEIKGIARVKVPPGQARRMEAADRASHGDRPDQGPRQLQYEVFFNADESEAIVFERYRDADAAIEHFANISHLMEPLMATASVTGEVLGTPNAQMREQLADGGPPTLFTPWMAIEPRV